MNEASGSITRRRITREILEKAPRIRDGETYFRLNGCPDCGGRGWFCLNPFTPYNGRFNYVQCPTCLAAKEEYDRTGKLPTDIQTEMLAASPREKDKGDPPTATAIKAARKRSKTENPNRGWKYKRTRIVHPSFPDDPNLEKVFADAWEAENTGHDRLQSMFYENHQHTHTLTRRERMIVATVIQWLGTNVGFCWLLETLRKAGYDVCRQKPKGGERRALRIGR